MNEQKPPITGEHRRDASAETFKSAAIGAVSGAGLAYGFGMVLDRIIHGQWRANLGTPYFVAACVAGAFGSAYMGYSKNREVTYSNDRIDFFEKHVGEEGAGKIVMNTLSATSPKIEHSKTQDILGSISTMALIGSFITPPQAGTGNVFQKMAFLSGNVKTNVFDILFWTTLLAELGAHITNMETRVTEQRKVFSHADKLIQERASVKPEGAGKN